MRRLGLHQRKKLLTERSPGGLYGSGARTKRTFAERLRVWLGKCAKEMDCSYSAVVRQSHMLQSVLLIKGRRRNLV